MSQASERAKAEAVVKAAVKRASKRVEAAKVVTALEREVAQCAIPVEIGGWQIVGGHRRKMVPVVSQLGRPVDGERRKSLESYVAKVHGLIGAPNMWWRMVTSHYTAHVGDEMLCMV